MKFVDELKLNLAIDSSKAISHMKYSVKIDFSEYNKSRRRW